MIDYSILDASVKYYSDKEFQRVEVPWTVSKSISALTKPEDKIDYELVHNGKVLVASAEQSFLYLYLKEFLPKGKFQAITPCFRDETFDSTHSKYFMKNELIITGDVTPHNLNNIVDIAFEFFKKYINDGLLYIIQSGNTFDIMYGDIELGSYGIRSCYFLDWIYGTGVAEPRLSNLIRHKNGISSKTDR